MPFCSTGPEGRPGTGPKNCWKSPKGFWTVRSVLMLTTAGRTRATAGTKGLRSVVRTGDATIGGRTAAAAEPPGRAASVAPATPPAAATSATMTANQRYRSLIIAVTSLQMSGQGQGQGEQRQGAHGEEGSQP